jgi:hypothetical protein
MLETRPYPSDNRYLVREDGQIVGPKGFPLKAIEDEYLRIHVGQATGKKYIHHIVAETYIRPRPDGMLVLHKDGNKRNNHWKNLYYGTYHQNSCDRFIHAIQPANNERGETHMSGVKIANSRSLFAPVIDLDEHCDTHCKAYIQQSMDKAVKLYQAKEIENSGENVTYSEAVRRLLLMGLAQGIGVKLKGAV